MLAAVAAASIPGSVVVFALTSTLVRLDRYPAVRIALSVGMIVAAVLVLSSARAACSNPISAPARGRARCSSLPSRPACISWD